MLNFEEFKEKLTSIEKGPGWLHAYVDRTGSYWVRAYGGMGTTIFKKLAPEHPFISYIEILLKDDCLIPEAFRYEYEAGEELAKLHANTTIDPDCLFDDLDKARESGELSQTILKKTAEGLLGHIQADHSISEDESILSAIESKSRKGNIFELLDLDDAQADELLDKANLMISLRDKYIGSGLSKSEFGCQIGLDQSQVTILLDGQIEAFTLEDLAGYLDKLP